MIQYDIIWYNMIQYDILWYNIIWCNGDGKPSSGSELWWWLGDGLGCVSCSTWDGKHYSTAKQTGQ